MKTITREVTIYTYTFAKVDVAQGTIMETTVIEKATPMKREEKRRISETTGMVLVYTEEKTCKFSLPLEEFVLACKKYANENTTDADQGDTDVSTDNSGTDEN